MKRENFKLHCLRFFLSFETYRLPLCTVLTHVDSSSCSLLGVMATWSRVSYPGRVPDLPERCKSIARDVTHHASPDRGQCSLLSKALVAGHRACESIHAPAVRAQPCCLLSPSDKPTDLSERGTRPTEMKVQLSNEKGQCWK